MAAVLAGEEVFAGRLAGAEVILDPKIFLHLPVEYLARILHPVAGQIFALRHDPDADHVVMLGNVPEPPFIRHVSDGGGPFVNIRFPF